MRLDLRLPSQSTRQLPVPALGSNFAYRLFRRNETYQAAGRGARPAAPLVSEEERFFKLHCGRCRKPSAAVNRHKAVNEGVTYRICMVCYCERRACGGQDSKVWECPSAAKGKSDCLCWCEPAARAGARGANQSMHRAKSKSTTR